MALPFNPKGSVVLYTGCHWQQAINAYYRNTENERILVILNFTGRNKSLSLPEHTYGKTPFSTHRNPEEFSYFQYMQIGPFEATICQVVE